MITHLFCSKTLKKQLMGFRKAGKKGSLAANQCERIMESIRHEGCITESLSAKRTKNGECRIGNCIKYDLGNGYRMVTILQDSHLYIPFAGTHDEVDLWLHRHKRDAFAATDNSFEFEKVGCTIRPEDHREIRGSNRETREPDLYEEYLQSQIEESLLRSIFQGLHR